MARVEVNISLASTVTKSSQHPNTVRTPGGARYQFFTSPVDNNYYWSKSTDGLLWTDPVLIRGMGGTQSGFCVYYDRETPGDTGTRIHTWYFEQTTDDVFYRYLDTSDDSLSTEVVVFAGLSTAGGTNFCISGAKMRGGNLLMAFDIDGGAETGVYRSTDGGANWTSRADLNEGTSDFYIILPGFAADNQDAIAIFWDRSADEISRKIYDDSANTWAETSIATSMADFTITTAAPQFSAIVDATNSKILLAAWTAADTPNADLRFWSVTESAITEGTNIVLNSTDDQGMVSLGLATDTNTIYAFYGGKSDGSEVFPTAINVYYKTSTDGGTTWGDETKVTNTTRGYDFISTYRNFTGSFELAIRSETSALDTLVFSTDLPGAPNRVVQVGQSVSTAAL